MKDVYLAETVLEFGVLFERTRQTQDPENFGLMLLALSEMKDIARQLIEERREACYKAYYEGANSGTPGA